MPMHLGTTGGLILGTLLTAVSAVRKGRATGWDPEAVGANVLESFIGYDLGDPGKGHNVKNMRFTVPVVAGGAATWIAKKTNYNQDTPKGVNV